MPEILSGGGAAGKIPLRSLPYHGESEPFSSHEGRVLRAGPQRAAPPAETSFVPLPVQERLQGRSGDACGHQPRHTPPPSAGGHLPVRSSRCSASPLRAARSGRPPRGRGQRKAAPLRGVAPPHKLREKRAEGGERRWRCSPFFPHAISHRPLPPTHRHAARASVKLPAQAPTRLSPHPPPGGAGAASPGEA